MQLVATLRPTPAIQQSAIGASSPLNPKTILPASKADSFEKSTTVGVQERSGLELRFSPEVSAFLLEKAESFEKLAHECFNTRLGSLEVIDLGFRQVSKLGTRSLEKTNDGSLTLTSIERVDNLSEQAAVKFLADPINSIQSILRGNLTYQNRNHIQVIFNNRELHQLPESSTILFEKTWKLTEKNGGIKMTP
jgi:hypothetical protein